MTGMRPGGSSSSVVRSRSPKITMAAVRGIGVAVITSRSGSPSVPLARSVARCSTPKRCCSSITTAPSDPNATSSVSSAWVPTTMPTSPEASPSSTAVRALPLTRLVRQLHADLAARHAAGALQVAEQRADGREVLLGQHLGRHHQRALVPALHRRQQGGQRDHGLARPDVALEQAVHGEGPGHVGHDHGQRPALGLRQLVGQAGQEARHQRVAHRARDLAGRHVVVQRAGVDLEGAAAQHQRELQAEELVEHEPAPGGLDHVERLGRVDGPEGLGPLPQVERGRATRRAGGRRTRRPARAPPRRTPRSPSWSARPWPTPGTRGGSAACAARASRPPPRRRRGWPSGARPGTRRPSRRRSPRCPPRAAWPARAG